MGMKVLRNVSGCLLMVSFMAAAGCGSGNPPVLKGVTVTGKIVRDGKPLEIPNLGPGVAGVVVNLVPSGSSDFETAQAQADGSFVFEGQGKGVKAGSYKLAVIHQNQGFGSDALNGALSNETTPIQVTIPTEKIGGTHDLGTIELAEHLKNASGS